MATAVYVEFPGATAEDYERVMQNLALEGTPEGAICHVSVAMDDALRVLDVWESREAFEGFLESRLQAAFEAAGVELASPPKYHEVLNVISVERAPSPAA